MFVTRGTGFEMFVYIILKITIRSSLNNYIKIITIKNLTKEEKK